MKDEVEKQKEEARKKKARAEVWIVAPVITSQRYCVLHACMHDAPSSLCTPRRPGQALAAERRRLEHEARVQAEEEARLATEERVRASLVLH